MVQQYFEELKAKSIPKWCKYFILLLFSYIFHLKDQSTMTFFKTLPTKWFPEMFFATRGIQSFEGLSYLVSTKWRVILSISFKKNE